MLRKPVMKVRLALLFVGVLGCGIVGCRSEAPSGDGLAKRDQKRPPAPIVATSDQETEQPPWEVARHKERREPEVQCPRISGGLPVSDSVQECYQTRKKYRLIVDLNSQLLHFSGPSKHSERDSLKHVFWGDTVEVTAEKAALMSGSREVATVPRGSLLGVAEFDEPWVRTAVLQEGTRKVGWIHIDEVQLHSDEGGLLPTPADIEDCQFASAGLLVLKSKVFDDGLYAAVELAAQKGIGKFAGKESLFQALAAHFAQANPTSLEKPERIVLGGAKLGGARLTLPAPLLEDVDGEIDRFMGVPRFSKPMGFYTWSNELTRIFQQDRMLQTRFFVPGYQPRPAQLERLLTALHGNPEARATYAAYLRLVSRLTNPTVGSDLRDSLKALDEGREIQNIRLSGDVSFFPPSRGHETELVKELFEYESIPKGFNLADELVKRIRAGTLDLAPKEDSGWYDYQTWALEPMVVPERMPEGKHIRIDDDYREKLIELFKGAYALTRETHIKQLETPSLPTAPQEDRFEEPKIQVFVPLELSGEPLPTYYLRRAESYAFIRTVLEETFGPEALTRMHRLNPDGPVDKTLDEELRWMESLFRGAYTTVGRQLGMAVPSGSQDSGGGDPEADARLFLNWTANLSLDPDLARDTRMMVPIFYDVDREKTKVWAMFGWQSYPLRVTRERRPEVRVLDSDGKPLGENRYDLTYDDRRIQTVIIPITAEFYVDRLLNREEFRKVVDTYRTKSAVLQNVAAEE